MDPRTFDPSAAAGADSGLFGLPHGPDEAAVHVLPAPFDATASYRKGAWKGPAAILRASRQVDLFDLEHGRPYEAGIWMAPDAGGEVEALNRRATALADAVIAAGGEVAGDARLEADLAQVNSLGARLNELVRARTLEVYGRGALPALVGGDHSTPFGAIQAAAERHRGLGLLHFDAHADLRVAYEGFAWSHASIMDNVLRHVDGVARIVQVGVRDLCEEERDAIDGSRGRVRALYDRDWQRAKLERADLRALVRERLAELPREVWISFDVDGLDPTLCPHTGTPVPGGLLWGETMLWLSELVASGRRVVGLDLNEVNPGPEWDPATARDDAWDAIVGARLLYRLIATALATRHGSDLA
jgi:agmatinase